MRLFFSALQAFLQGITKICEGEGRKLQVRSLRYGVEESAQVPLIPIHPPNPTLSGPVGQGWTCRDPAVLGVQPAAWCLQPQQWRPPSSRLWMGDVPGQKPHLGRSQLPAARQFFSMAFSLGSDRPFPGLWPLPSRGRIDHLVNEALGSKFLQLRSQMQLVGILFEHVRLWFLNSELVSRFFKGERLHVKIYLLLNIQISGYPEPIIAMAAGSELPSPLLKRQVSPGTPNCTTSFPGGPGCAGGGWGGCEFSTRRENSMSGLHHALSLPYQAPLSSYHWLWEPVLTSQCLQPLLWSVPLGQWGFCCRKSLQVYPLSKAAQIQGSPLSLLLLKLSPGRPELKSRPGPCLTPALGLRRGHRAERSIPIFGDSDASKTDSLGRQLV